MNLKPPDGAGARTLYPVRWWWQRVKVVAVLATLLVCASGETAQARMFYLQTPRLGADFEYSFREETQTTPNRKSQISSHRFLEGLNLASRGYVYHPALLVFELNLEPSWEQQQQTYNSRDTARSSFFLDYGFDGTLFQERQLSLRLMARRGTSTTSTSLAPSSSNENTLYSASLRYRSRTLPTLLTYMRNERQQEGFYSSTQLEDRLTLRSDNKNEWQATSLKAEYEKQQRQAQGPSQDRQSYRFDLSNNLKLTADQRITLQSTLQSRWLEFQNQKSSNLSLDERLTWLHTDPEKRLQIQSEYFARYSADRQDDELREDIPLEARISLSHLLYENLVSSLDADTGYRKYGDGEETTYGASYNFDYNRRVPIGRISLKHGQNYQIRDTSALPSTIVVSRLNPELLSFDAFDALFFRARLVNRHVDISTIELFDADGFSYVNAFDYNIIEVGGGFVEVSVIGGSDLDVYLNSPGPKQVLASYRYRSDPTAKVATHTRTFGAGLGLGSALTLRYQLTLREEQQLDGDPIHSLDDDTLQEISAQLRYDWSETEVTYNDDRRTDGDSSRRWLARQTFSWRPIPAMVLTLGGRYRQTELVDTGESGRNYSLDAGGQWRLRNNLQWRAAMTYQTSSTTRPVRSDPNDLLPKFLDTDESGYRLETSGQWQVRGNQQWRVAMIHQTRTTSRPDNTDKNNSLELEYLRRFQVWQFEAKYRYLLNEQSLSGVERSENRIDLVLRRELF